MPAPVAAEPFDTSFDFGANVQQTEMFKKSRRKKGLISDIDKKTVQRSFPGAKMTPLRDGPGWQVELASGHHIAVRLVNRVPIDWDAAEKAANRKFTPAERKRAEAHGSFTVTGPNGTTIDGLGIVLLSNRTATDKTVRHEALHVARSLGLFTVQEWNSLVEKHSTLGKSALQQEEDIATAAEAWTG